MALGTPTYYVAEDGTESVKIAITRAGLPVTIMAFITLGRGPTPPAGAVGFGAKFWRRDPSDENVLATIEKLFRGQAPMDSWRFISDDDLPTGPIAYRNAWIDPGEGALSHDMEKARDIHREILRSARTPELEDLDVAYQRADEAATASNGKDLEEAIALKKAVATAKQRLRDVTADPAIEAAQTVEELVASWPADLLAEVPTFPVAVLSGTVVAK